MFCELTNYPRIIVSPKIKIILTL